ncbi:MAG: FtsX-like permease family protein [Syntrophobacteraceae bacterium]|nr:FtsX-like permease family protein [Syntrophobacteraceae bacterium]
MSRIERQRNIIDFTLSSLLRRKRKTIALILVYVLIVFTLGSVLLFTQAMKKEASLILAGAPEMVVQRMTAGRQSLFPVGYIDKIRAIKGVGAARGRLWGYYFDPRTRSNFTFLVPKVFEAKPSEIVVGRGIARSLDTSEDDLLYFRAFDGTRTALRIRGVFDHRSELVASDLILIGERDFRRLFGVPEGYSTDAVLEVKNSKELGIIAFKITQVLPDTRPIRRDLILGTYEAVFNWRGGMALVVLSGAVLAFVILAWDKATGLSAEERREIGILKAIGWDTSDVLLMKFWESAAISITSFFAGILLAYAHVFLASAPLFAAVLKGWSVLYPKFRPAPFIDFYDVAVLFFITVVPYAAATLVPSWRAATLDPDEVMR